MNEKLFEYIVKLTQEKQVSIEVNVIDECIILIIIENGLIIALEELIIDIL